MKKQLLLVGNASTLNKSNFGKTIDSYDCVVRFNKYDISDQYKSDYGEKTNIWIVNGFEYKTMKKTPNILDHTYISSTTKNKNKMISYLHIKKLDNITLLDKNDYDKVKLHIDYPYKYSISLGLFSIIYFVEKGYDVFITNMNHKPVHYFENVNPKLGKNHDWNFEKKYIEKLIKNKIISQINP